MYAIATMFYGFPLVSNSQDYSVQPCTKFPRLDKAVDERDEGFFSFYHGGSNFKPCAFGVELGTFDSCDAYLPLSEMHTTLTDEHKEAFDSLLASLSPELQGDLARLGQPSVFLLWHTS